jgi:DNA (cytosine-5)-methyltransferase 1
VVRGVRSRKELVAATMTSRPRLLDLFCGAGGASVGYHRAGFDVVGVDNRPQPRYPFRFICDDALNVLAGDFRNADGLRLAEFDAIHASPPCQVFSIATQHARGNHKDLLTPIRGLLAETGVPWVIENVPGAPMRADYKLCGCMFGLNTQDRQLVRERWFETSWHGFDLRSPCDHQGRPAITITTKGQPNRTGYADEAIASMGIDWMNSHERGLAIPPAYTEYLGARLLEHLAGVAA